MDLMASCFRCRWLTPRVLAHQIIDAELVGTYIVDAIFNLHRGHTFPDLNHSPQHLTNTEDLLHYALKGQRGEWAGLQLAQSYSTGLRLAYCSST